jgi:hypothetical protein
VKFFDIRENVVKCYELPKAIAIKKLSSDLIRYSEHEQLLSIINTIQIANKPVLFTEGSTDPLILTQAWNHLYNSEMPVIPFYAFSSGYIKQLLTDSRIHQEMGGLPMFALFDFDKAYDQWNDLNGDVLIADPQRGLIKKWKHGESYAIMLPIPPHPDLQRQVIKDAASGETFGGESYCEIEHLFYGQTSAAPYFHNEPCPGGQRVAFKSDGNKVAFAKEIVPTLPRECFAPLAPVFDFIRGKCQSQPR